MAEIYQLRDFQSKKTEERIKQMAAEIMNQDQSISGDFVGVPYGGAGIDGIPYWSPENDAS
jgi:hypothetical protein